MTEVNNRATEGARSSYGRLLAMLCARSGDVVAAEDALADAFTRALETWPSNGIPAKPEAWLFTVARNRLFDHARSAARYPLDELDMEQIVGDTDREEESTFPDERLKLLFVCAHPSIDPQVHTPLMLQTVLGLDAETIGRAFLIPGTTLGQRLVRAKNKIKIANIPFSYPAPEDLKSRRDAVLEAIYGAYSADWFAHSTAQSHEDLSGESIYLATLIAELMPEEPEALGLAALLMFIHARRDARFSDDGTFVPLPEQSIHDWDSDLIDKAEQLLQRAHGLNKIGRYQLEAAIQSVHSSRIRGVGTNWVAIAHLYEGLFQIAPTIGCAVGRAAAVGEAYGAKAGLGCLDEIDTDVQEKFQPAWATRAWLLKKSGDIGGSRIAFEKAILLTNNNAIAAYLTEQLNTRDDTI